MKRIAYLTVLLLTSLLSACGSGVKNWCGIQAYPRVLPEGVLDPRAMMHIAKHPEKFSISTGEPAISLCSKAAPGTVELRARCRDGQEQRYLLSLDNTGAAMACVTAQGGIFSITDADTPPADWLLLVVMEPQYCYMIWNPATGGENRRFVSTGPASSPAYAVFTLAQDPQGYFTFSEKRR